MNREFRYMVIKVKDAIEYLSEVQGEQLDRILDKIASGREKSGKIPLECVVIESDWPEYEFAWKLIEDRVNGENK